MLQRMKRLVFLLALLLVPSLAAAGKPTPPPVDPRFAAMDADGNGIVTWEEFSAAMPQMRRAAFDSIDTDKNGDITRQEWDAFRASHGKNGMHGGMPGGMPPAPKAAPDQTPNQDRNQARPGILPPSDD